MDRLDNFIALLTKVLDYLPRYMDLSENKKKTPEETIEFEILNEKLDDLKDDLVKLIPELNYTIYENIVETYYSIKKEADSGDKIAKSRYEDMKEIFQEPLKKWMKESVN